MDQSSSRDNRLADADRLKVDGANWAGWKKLLIASLQRNKLAEHLEKSVATLIVEKSAELLPYVRADLAKRGFAAADITGPRADSHLQQTIEQNDRAVKFAIQINLDLETATLFDFADDAEAHAVWKLVGDFFESKTAAAKVNTMRELTSFKQRPTESLEPMVVRYRQVVYRNRSVGNTIDESMLIMFLLGALQPEYQRAGDACAAKQTIEEVYNDLIDIDRRDARNTVDKEGQESHGANRLDDDSRDVLECYKCGFKGHYLRDCPNKPKGCRECGHFQAKCHMRGGRQRGGRGNRHHVSPPTSMGPFLPKLRSWPESDNL